VYPCPTVDFIDTYEFDGILLGAGYSQDDDLRDLNIKMLVLGWLHEINIELAYEWKNRDCTTDPDELAIVWIIMGHKLLEKKYQSSGRMLNRGCLPKGRQGNDSIEGTGVQWLSRS